MVVNFKTLNYVEQLDVDALHKMHTGSLLARLKSLRSLQNSFDVSDWTSEERDAVEAAGFIAFKDSGPWEAAFSDLKSVLSEREHVPRGSKEQRQKAAFLKQNR